MDDSRFDALVKGLSGASRRGLVGAAGAAALSVLFGGEGVDEALGKRKKRKKKKNRKRPEPCGGATVCSGGRFCCDDEREICCNRGDGCCNVGPGTGSCCSPPNRCARPVDNGSNSGAPFECCPPERLSTAFGELRCCPVGTRSLGDEISTDDGQCCPEEKYCSQASTGGKCCPDIAPVCLDRDTGACCNQEAACGNTCCSGILGDCCNGECRNSDFGPWQDCGDFCCPAGKTCCGSGQGGICCTPGGSSVCAIPCGDLPHACCTPESFANGACCNSDCGEFGCGG